MKQLKITSWIKPDDVDIFEHMPLDYYSGYPNGSSNHVYFEALPVVYTYGDLSKRFRWKPITFNSEGKRCN